VSLNGNLEDLPLLDILQIVSFSKKTGYLSIRTEAGEGAIVFTDGFVVAAFSAETPPFDPRYRHLPPEARTPLLRQSIDVDTGAGELRQHFFGVTAVFRQQLP